MNRVESRLYALPLLLPFVKSYEISWRKHLDSLTESGREMRVVPRNEAYRPTSNGNLKKGLVATASSIAVIPVLTERGSLRVEVDGVREGVVLFVPADQFDHHGTGPGFVHDSVVDGPAPAPDGLLHAGVTERSRTVQSIREFPPGLKLPVDLRHQFFSRSVEITDSFEFDGIMVGVGITINELNI